MGNTNIRATLLALLLALPGLAQAVPEQEQNAPAASAQRLEIKAITVDNVPTTGAIVDGSIGINVGGTPVLDFDYYVFEGKQGDTVTLDIDKGWDGGRRVDTVIAIFGPAPAYKTLSYNDDSSPLDPGSVATRDSRIVNFTLPVAGDYTVGVAAVQSTTRNVWTTSATPTGNNVKSADSNGDYTLIISGVSLAVQQISIDVKPGSGEFAPINPKSRGKVPVALLGSSAFSVDDVDVNTLTFGPSGDESSFSKCGTPGDVNGDLWPDMVCHFENQKADFGDTDDQAILRGRLEGGARFEGRGWLKIVPVKAPE